MAKGMFKPLQPEKYLGDPNKIRFLSSWERIFMDFCDKNPNILKWGSEEFRIPYRNPIRKKVCNYFPDFIVTYKNSLGQVLTEVIEIKPSCQAFVRGKKKPSTYDTVQMIINEAKWTAAKAFCDSHNIKFRVLTEKNLFLK